MRASKRGRGSNARALGVNPRALGTDPRRLERVERQRRVNLAYFRSQAARRLDRHNL